MTGQTSTVSTSSVESTDDTQREALAWLGRQARFDALVERLWAAHEASRDGERQQVALRREPARRREPLLWRLGIRRPRWATS